jgi:hypothetical protein
MAEPLFDPWEAQVRATARAFSYPATPDIATAVAGRLGGGGQMGRRQQPRLALALALLLALVVGLLGVPQVRAGLIEFLQLGAVRIWLVAPTATPVPPSQMHPSEPPQPPATALPDGAPGTGGLPPPRLPATRVVLNSVFDLAGETTLAEARASVDFEIPLPTALPELGPPDYVFLQDEMGTVVVLVWVDPDDSGRARMSLHLLGPGALVQKGQPPIHKETVVAGGRALWTEGPYLLSLDNGGFQQVRLVAGHVLVWQQGLITYRLESDLPLEEAVRVAESLR